MIRTKIKIDLERVCSPTKLLLGIQYENNDHTLIFEFADVLDSMNKYVIFNNKEKTLIYPLISNEIKITNSVTFFDGVWNIHVMCRSMELNLDDEIVKMDTKENETVYISNVIRGYVEKASFKKEDVEAVEMDENIKVVYDDLLKLKAQLQSFVDSGGSGGETSQEVLDRLSSVEAKAKGNADNITDLYNTDYVIQENMKVLNDELQTKINDVKINDTSIVTDGVANIEHNKVQSYFDTERIPSTYTVSNTWTNIEVRNGFLNTRVTQNKHIDNRGKEADKTCLNPETLDYAVKQAMCDGKGAEWTSAEKESARNRMGLEWGLIDTIEVTDVSQVEITFPQEYNEFMVIADIKGSGTSMFYPLYGYFTNNEPDLKKIQGLHSDFYPSDKDERFELTFEKMNIENDTLFKVSGFEKTDFIYPKLKQNTQSTGWRTQYDATNNFRCHCFHGVKFSRTITTATFKLYAR